MVHREEIAACTENNTQQINVICVMELSQIC
jgi:hypothetical protein